jgi:CrcB protein
MQLTSKTIRLTFLGGAFGTLLRFALFVTLGDLVSVLIVNLIGSALLGWFNGNKNNDTDEFNAFWKTGFAGGFTTMSGFAALIVLYGQNLGALAIVSAILITAVSLAAYWFAFKIARAK